MKKRIGVVLSGCGVYDGSEIHVLVERISEVSEGITRTVEALLELI